MNTLQDLRHTLDQHASSVHGDLNAARVAAVRGRARKVRRHRAAGVGVAAVLVVVAATAVPMLAGDRTPVPPDRQLIGKVAPETMTSLGYTYHFAEGVESGDKPATVRVGAADEPRLVTWVSDADEVQVDSNVDGYSTGSRETDFDDFVFVPAAQSARFTVRAGGADSALAVYELGDEQPEGFTVDGITFRQQVADANLLAAGIGDPGDHTVSVQVTLPEGVVRIAGLCQGSIPRGYWFNVAVGDHGAVSRSGCGDTGFDPGAGDGYSFRVPAGQVGDTVPVSAWMSRGPEGPGVALDDVRLGIGAYQLGEPVEKVAGQPVPEHEEYAGKLWEFRASDSVSHFEDAGRTTVFNTFGEPVLVAGYFTGTGKRSMIRFRYGDLVRVAGSNHEQISGTNFRAGDTGGPIFGVLPQPGQSARIAVIGSASADAALGIATYVRVD